MGTHVESLPARQTARNIWVTIGVLALLALAIGTGVAIGRATVAEPAPLPEPLGLASTEVVQMVDAHIAAMNAVDTAAFEAFYGPAAVVTNWTGTEIPGPHNIARKFTKAWGGLAYLRSVERVSDVFQAGDFTAYLFTLGEGSRSQLMVLKLDVSLRIIHQWMIVWP